MNTKNMEEPTPTIISVVKGKFDGTNGLERFFYVFSQALRSARQKHIVFCYEGGITPANIEKLEAFGIRVWIPKNRSGSAINASNYARFFIELYKCCKATNADLIFAHYSKPCNVALVVGNLLNIPTIRVVHSCNLVGASSSKGVKQAIRRLIANSCTYTIAVSKAVYRFEVDSGLLQNKLKLIYHGLKLADFASPKSSPKMRNELGISEHDTILLVAAAFVELKGHRYLFQALEEIGQDAPTLLLAGNGPLLEDLKAAVAKSKISSKVHFIGHRTDVVDVINACDCVVLPSLTEAFGQVLIEAMACKKPIIATKVDGIIEVVEDGITGVLVEPKNVKDLAAAVRDLMNDPKRWINMGLKGYDRVISTFDVETTVSEYMKIVTEVLQKRNRL